VVGEGWHREVSPYPDQDVLDDDAPLVFKNFVDDGEFFAAADFVNAAQAGSFCCLDLRLRGRTTRKNHESS
jgi:hypothetical protein